MTRGRPRKIDPEKALHEAMLMFWRKGYDATSMSDLVGATGMAKPGLYATFGDKQAIYKKALENYGAFRGRPLAAKLLSSKGQAKEALREFFFTVVNVMCEDNVPDGCFLADTLVKSENEEPEITELAKRMHEMRRQHFEDFLRNAQKNGNLDEKHDVVMLADYFVAQVLTITVLHKTGSDKETLHKFIDTVMKILGK